MNLPEEDITLDPEWIEEQVDRLAAWEYLNRYVKHELDQPMRPHVDALVGLIHALRSDSSTPRRLVGLPALRSILDLR